MRAKNNNKKKKLIISFANKSFTYLLVFTCSFAKHAHGGYENEESVTEQKNSMLGHCFMWQEN